MNWLNFLRKVKWLEFKHNFHSPEEIGERISVLSNGACLQKQSYGYLIFGVQDKSNISTIIWPQKRNYALCFLQKNYPTNTSCMHIVLFNGFVNFDKLFPKNRLKTGNAALQVFAGVTHYQSLNNHALTHCAYRLFFAISLILPVKFFTAQPVY